MIRFPAVIAGSMAILLAVARSSAADPGAPAPAPLPTPAPPRTPASGPTDVTLPQLTMPYSSYASPEAKARFARILAAARDGSGQPREKGLAAARDFWNGWNDDRLAEVNARYRSDIRDDRLGGVAVKIVTPRTPTSGNAGRVLINLHGGAFMWGWPGGALAESIPIAVTAGMTVIAVNYRMAPQHHYPAASEDAAAVYRALLTRYRPENIGIYGCSAGGVLTAQATAWFQSHGLPRPGAIGTFCGSGIPFGGDSTTTAPPAVGERPMGGAAGDGPPPLGYLDGVAQSDGDAYPANAPARLAGFPPTLLISGSRDFAASAVTTMHRRLVAAGAPADLFIYDGMWHAFVEFPELPEAQESYRVIARFFDRHLGRAPMPGGRPL